MTTKLITLHCPSLSLTHPSFVISPFQSPEQVLQGIRLCLGISYAALYTVDAKHISDPRMLQEGERVLVAARKGEVVLPDAGVGWIVYSGEDLGEEDVGWEDLTDAEKCAHITHLTTQDPTTRNILRITRPWSSVEPDIAALTSTSTSNTPDPTADPPTEVDAPPDSDPPTTPSPTAAATESTIEARWSLPLDTFLPPSLKPPRLRPSGTFFSLPVLSTLSLLSSLTHGQARLARGVLEEAVAMRLEETRLDELGLEAERDSVVRAQDVLNAVTMVYEREGSVAARLTGKKSEKGRGKERRKAARGRKRAAGGS